LPYECLAGTGQWENGLAMGIEEREKAINSGGNVVGIRGISHQARRGAARWKV